MVKALRCSESLSCTLIDCATSAFMWNPLQHSGEGDQALKPDWPGWILSLNRALWLWANCIDFLPQFFFQLWNGNNNFFVHCLRLNELVNIKPLKQYLHITGTQLMVFCSHYYCFIMSTQHSIVCLLITVGYSDLYRCVIDVSKVITTI